MSFLGDRSSTEETVISDSETGGSKSEDKPIMISKHEGTANSKMNNHLRRRSSFSVEHSARRTISQFLEIQASTRLLGKEEDEENHHPSSKSWPIKIAFVIAGVLVGFVMCFKTIEDNPHINQTLAIGIWMATLWITEIIPLVVTAFLPLVLFPLFGILSSSDVAAQYINNTIFLFIAGLLIALTLERWNLHRRFSLKVLQNCGTKPPVLLLGMMTASFFLSMFISNTATTLMMVPNALSICTTLEASGSASYKKQSKRFTVALMLGIAYAANVGGMASLIGTAPNLVFQRQLELLFPDAPEITFAHWIAFGLPTGLIMLVLIWIYLSFMYLSNFQNAQKNIDSSVFKTQYLALGKWTREQGTVTCLFFILCLLWLFRSDLIFDSFSIPGWSNIFPQPSYISDATSGMLIVILLFICPARSRNLACNHVEGDESHQEDEMEEQANDASNTVATEVNQSSLSFCSSNDTTLLDWETANKMPYDIIFLIGGGFALASAFVQSGLSEFLGDSLASLDISLPALLFVLVTLIIWLTELTSNTSTSNIMVPVAASIAVALQASPYTFMLPATMACSCAFVLPIATPPNMVVFSTGRVPMREMNKAGVLLNVVCSLILFGAAFTIIPAVLRVPATEFPSWAETSPLFESTD